MNRSELIQHLLNAPKSVRQLAMDLKQPAGAVANDLQHIAKSLKHQPYRLDVIPAKCRRCDFVFDDTRYRKPSKCPECKGTWLTEPIVCTRFRDDD